MRKLIKLVNLFLRPNGKYSFISNLRENVSILDVGCGKTPNRILRLFPRLDYYGIDISRHTNTSLARNLIISNKDHFVDDLKLLGQFEAVICSHNLEHVDNRDLLLNALICAVKPGGRIYLSFPSENSINFPSRKYTLNYYDDKTHKDLPPNFEEICNFLISNNYEIIFKVKYYRPLILTVLGFILEPLSVLFNKCFIGTFEYYGFETIIHAERKV